MTIRNNWCRMILALGVKFLKLAGDVLDGVGLDGHWSPRRPPAREKTHEIEIVSGRNSIRPGSEAHLLSEVGSQDESSDHENDDDGKDWGERDPKWTGCLFATLLGVADRDPAETDFASKLVSPVAKVPVNAEIFCPLWIPGWKNGSSVPQKHTRQVLLSWS